MQDHPLVLKFLEAFVRRPLENTAIDRHVFLPCKNFYLECVKQESKTRHAIAGKND
jgi:hypothetical protein